MRPEKASLRNPGLGNPGQLAGMHVSLFNFHNLYTCVLRDSFNYQLHKSQTQYSATSIIRTLLFGPNVRRIVAMNIS